MFDALSTTSSHHRTSSRRDSLDYQILQRTLRPKDGQAAAETTTSPNARTTIPLEVATDTSKRGLGDAVRFDLYGDVRIDTRNVVFGRLFLLRFDNRG
ncbi:MAG: hypothetical protein E6Q72_02450 [Pseudomonas sp.]|nr:MAG: hypothetical protein E6Q72_02450 [Pseudomonas sp.]